MLLSKHLARSRLLALAPRAKNAIASRPERGSEVTCFNTLDAPGRFRVAPIPFLSAGPSGLGHTRPTDYLVRDTHPTGDPLFDARGMRVTRTGLAVQALLVVLATAACGGAPRPAAEPTPEPATSTAELEAIYRARTDSARLRFTEADVRFMTGMIGHHAQALVMARLAPTHRASPAVRTLCARILNAQQDEIATMQRWLRDRRQTVPEVHITGTTLMLHGPGYAMHMPGMLTPDQMQELDESRGQEFDRLFLTYMIQHHRGAVTMVHDLFGTDGAALDDVVFKLASDIQVDQITEIARMELMLEQLSDTGRGP